MIRILLTLWLTAFLIVQPCVAQLTQEQLRTSREENSQRVEMFRQVYKQKYAKALVDLAAAKNPALKARIEFFAAKTATIVGADYERPDPTTDLKPDFVQARHWYALGTQHGDTDGAYWLGQLYWDGHGGPADRERAKALWIWAADNGERKAVVKLEGLGYNMQKERELAFGKAQAPRAQQDDASDAAKGFLIVLGALLIAKVANDVNETPECREYRLAILAGTPASTMPAGCN